MKKRRNERQKKYATDFNTNATKTVRKVSCTRKENANYLIIKSLNHKIKVNLSSFWTLWQ